MSGVLIDFIITGDSTKNENSYASCSGLKKAGHFKSEIYNLKNPEDKWSRIAFCDMQNSDGYDDNSIESLLGYVNTSPEPAQIMFSVYSDKSEDIAAGNYVDFDHTWVNNGNHFSLSNGAFIAPIHGNYEFSFSGHSYVGIYAQIQVLKNGNKVQEFRTMDDAHLDNISPTWIIELKAGDEIRLRVSYGSLHSDSSSYRTFSGKLLEFL